MAEPIQLDIPESLYDFLLGYCEEEDISFPDFVTEVLGKALTGFAVHLGYEIPSAPQEEIPLVDRITQILAKHGPMPVSQISEKLGGLNGTTVRSALYRLEMKKEVSQTRSDAQPHGTPVMYWELEDEE